MPGWPNNNYSNTGRGNQNMYTMPNQMRQGMPMNMPMQNQNQMRQNMPMNMPMQNQNQMRQGMPMNMPMQNQNQMRQGMPMNMPMNMPMQNQNQMRQGMQMNMPMQNQNQMRQGMPMNMPMQNQNQNQMQQGMPMQNMPFQQQGAPQSLQPPGMPPEGMDGVRYEPLDANTLTEIRSSFASGKPQGDKNENLTEKPKGNADNAHGNIKEELKELKASPISVKSEAGSLEEFMQNEKNADSFYRRLASIAPAKHRKNLREIADGAKEREAALGQIYKAVNGQEFISEERKIERASNFKRGITRAIEEEVRVLKDMSSFYENMSDEKSARKMNSIMYKKVGDLCYLNMALHEL